MKHVDLARLISSVASERGAVADRGAVQEVQLAVASRPDEIDVAFPDPPLGTRLVLTRTTTGLGCGTPSPTP